MPKQVQNKVPAKPVIKKEKVLSNIKANNQLKSKLPSVNFDDSPDEDDGNEESGSKVDFFSLSSSFDVPDSDIQIPDEDPIDFQSKKEEIHDKQVPNELSNNQSISIPMEERSAYFDKSVTADYVTSSPATSSESYIPLDQKDITLNKTAVSNFLYYLSYLLIDL